MFFDYPTEKGEPEEVTGFLAAAGDDMWTTLAEFCEVRKLRAGEVLAAEGDQDRSLLFVTSGELEATVPRGRRGARRVLARYAAGSVVGEISFFDGAPRSASIGAVSDAEVFRLSFDSFESLCSIHPALGRRILLDLGRILATMVRTKDAQLERYR